MDLNPQFAQVSLYVQIGAGFQDHVDLTHNPDAQGIKIPILRDCVHQGQSLEPGLLNLII